MTYKIVTPELYIRSSECTMSKKHLFYFYIYIYKDIKNANILWIK